MLIMPKRNDKENIAVVAKHFYREKGRQAARIDRLARTYRNHSPAQLRMEGDRFRGLCPASEDEALTIEAHLEAIHRCLHGGKGNQA